VEQKFNLEKRINRLIEVYEKVILQK
jgi:hypothetical protein